MRALDYFINTAADLQHSLGHRHPRQPGAEDRYQEAPRQCAGHGMRFRLATLESAQAHYRQRRHHRQDLRPGEIHHHLTGVSPLTESGISPTTQTCMNQVRHNQPGPPRSACASSEEPGAAIPHAGICEGGVEQSASLPQSARYT